MKFRLEEGALPAMAGAHAAAIAAAPAPAPGIAHAQPAAPAAPAARREPVLAAAEDDDWKEF